MKATLYRLAALLLCAWALCSCSAYKRIALTSVGVESITPGQVNREMNVVLKLGIDNPAGKLRLSDVHGELISGDNCVGTFTAAPLELLPRQGQVVELPCVFTFEPGGTLMAIIKRQQIMDMTVDLHGVGRNALGFKKKVDRTGLKVMDLAKKFSL